MTKSRSAYSTPIKQGKFDTHIGYGINSLSISSKPPPYPKLGFKMKINERMNYEYFHGVLRSLIKIPSDKYSNDLATRSVTAKRNIVFHRIDYKLNENYL